MIIVFILSEDDKVLISCTFLKFLVLINLEKKKPNEIV